MVLCIGNRFLEKLNAMLSAFRPALHYIVYAPKTHEQSGQAVPPHTSRFYHESVQDCCYSVAADKAYNFERGVISTLPRGQSCLTDG